MVTRTTKEGPGLLPATQKQKNKSSKAVPNDGGMGVFRGADFFFFNLAWIPPLPRLNHMNLKTPDITCSVERENMTKSGD